MSMPLVGIALKASFVIAVAATANLLVWRRASAAWRHLVWTLAVAALLLLPALSAALPSWDLPIRVAASSPRIAAPASQTAEQPAADVSGPVGSGLPSPSGERASAPVAVATSQAAPDARIGSVVTWAEALAALYVAGVLLLLARLLAERWAIHRLARRAGTVSEPDWTRLFGECERAMGIRGRVRLLRSVARSMPLAFGTRRPAILIPSIADTWSEDRRRAVLLHELAHIARRDCLTQLLAAVACAVYWVHPGVWWVARRLRVERELACDDRVLAVGTRAREYAEHLLELAYTLGGFRAPALVVAMARPRQLEGRLLALLDDGRNRERPARRGRLAGIAIVAALVMPLAAAEATLVPVGSEIAQRGPAQSSGAATTADVAGQRLSGTWEIRASETAGLVELRLHERPNSSSGFTIAIQQLDGLSPALLSGTGGAAAFSIRRDAGTFGFEGTFRSGLGAGTYTFAPSTAFAAELVKRGFARPTFADQYSLARADIGFAYLDELNAQSYARPDLAQLVRAGDHGVGLDYLRGMGRAGYHMGQIDALITQRDHGVSPEFIRELGAQGLTGLSADDLVRARDHGVSPEYVRDLRQLGYELKLDNLVRARDHGVSVEYVRDLAGLGYQRLSLDELVGARDHGISPEYVRALHDLGYQLTLTELTRARDHGISQEETRALRDLGYQHLSLDDLVRLRDHGVSSAYAKEQNDRARTRLTIDQLVSLRDHGGAAPAVAGGISRFEASVRLAVNRFCALVDGWMR